MQCGCEGVQCRYVREGTVWVCKGGECECVREGDKVGTCFYSLMLVQKSGMNLRSRFSQYAFSSFLESARILSAPSWNMSFKFYYL